jgi:predicted amidophosphoribosyltransferase
MLSALLNFVFPAYCVSCGRRGQLLCPSCYQQIEFLPSAGLELSNAEALTQVRAMGHYQSPLKELIVAMKYRSVRAAAQLLGRMLHFHLLVPTVDVVTFVPTSRQRINQRGFNQAQVMAESLSAAMQRPFVKLLKKVKATKHQAKCDNDQERMANLQGAFTLTTDGRSLRTLDKQALNSLDTEKKDCQRSQPKIPRSDLHRGITVLIVDDVVTTGSTLNQCALVLKQAGVKKVYAAAAAHRC